MKKINYRKIKTNKKKIRTASFRTIISFICIYKIIHFTKYYSSRNTFVNFSIEKIVFYILQNIKMAFWAYSDFSFGSFNYLKCYFNKTLKYHKVHLN